MVNLNSFTQHKGKGVILKNEISSVSNKGDDTTYTLEMIEGSRICKILETSRYGDNEGEGDKE